MRRDSNDLLARAGLDPSRPWQAAIRPEPDRTSAPNLAFRSRRVLVKIATISVSLSSASTSAPSMTSLTFWRSNSPSRRTPCRAGAL
jgi:hypothetical protein